MNTIECQKKGCVLIIDDQPENIHVLANILQEHYDVQAATNGIKALEIASGNNPPDVILLDIVMPETDGYEVCHRLKADERTRDIPVIFVTVKDSADDEEYGFNLGAVDYISKPFQPIVVKVRVKSQMEHRLVKNKLVDKIKELNHALEQIKTLRGIVPICSKCKKIRDDTGYWHQVESYIEQYSEAKFSHGICVECSDELYGKEPWYGNYKKKRESKP